MSLMRKRVNQASAYKTICPRDTNLHLVHATRSQLSLQSHHASPQNTHEAAQEIELNTTEVPIPEAFPAAAKAEQKSTPASHDASCNRRCTQLIYAAASAREF